MHQRNLIYQKKKWEQAKPQVTTVGEKLFADLISNQIAKFVELKNMLPSLQTIGQETHTNSSMLKTCTVRPIRIKQYFSKSLWSCSLQSSFQILVCQYLKWPTFQFFSIFTLFCPCAGLCTTHNKEVHNEMAWIKSHFFPRCLFNPLLQDVD